MLNTGSLPIKLLGLAYGGINTQNCPSEARLNPESAGSPLLSLLLLLVAYDFLRCFAASTSALG